MSLNRIVQIISPSNDDDYQDRTFFDFINYPNIILLGDPGAGKSHLFECGSDHESAKLFTARSFAIYADRDSQNQVIYIDALDEKRSRVDADEGIDAIVKRLLEIKPEKVRISCRAMDWLGDTDLALLKPYFDESGGYVVLQLKDLTEEEQVEILRVEGSPDPSQFISEAERKGVSSLLRNPQTLKMLAAVVAGGRWPETKLELFEKSTEILLKEHNPDRAKLKGSSASLTEITEIVGSICSTLLISDEEGISLLHSSAKSEYPSFDTIEGSKDVLLDSLNRRVFRYYTDDVVTFSHRTIAEFLGAKWVALQVNNGLPLARLLSLICVNNKPAIELKGSFAWLPIFLPNSAIELINQDPLAVLSYGDPKSLTSEQRHSLLLSIESHSIEDPWFRDWSGGSEYLGNLSGKDMSLEFSRILENSESNTHLRSLILDSIAYGPKLPDLEQVLIGVLENENSEYIEKRGAYRALINSTTNGASLVRDYVRNMVSSNEDDLSLCTQIIKDKYEDLFLPDDVVNLIERYINAKSKIPIGDLWSLPDAIPDRDIEEILDRLVDLKPDEDDSSMPNEIEVASASIRLLIRRLKMPKEPESHKLWAWLKIIRILKQDLGHFEDSEIHEWLKDRPELLDKLFVVAWKEHDANNRWLFWHDFLSSVFRACSLDQFSTVLIKQVRDKRRKAQKRALAYELCLNIAYFSTPPNASMFEEMCKYSANDPVLNDVHVNNISCAIDDWQHKEAVRVRERKKEDTVQMNESLARFDSCKDLIRSGNHLGWLKWASEIFYGRFSDSDKSLNSYDRLVKMIGNDRATTVIEGLSKLLGNDKYVPSLTEILNIRNEGKYNKSWFTVLAAMHFNWQDSGNIEQYSDEILESAYAIELLHPVYERKADTNQETRVTHGWLDAITSTRLNLAVKVLRIISEDDICNKRNYSDAIFRLTSELPLETDVSNAVIELLKKYPNAAPEFLERFLITASKVKSLHDSLREIAQNNLDESALLEDEQKIIWNAFSFLFFDNASITKNVAAEISKSESIGILWEIKSLLPRFKKQDGGQGLNYLSDKQLKFLIEEFGSRFPPADPPKEGWNGDKNSWDASQFVHQAISEYSSRVRDESIEGLNQLLSCPSLASYKDLIQHSIANQASLYRQFQFNQPSWNEVVQTLKNGKPANSADLLSLTIDQLQTTRNQIKNANVDPFKIFWNEDSYSRILTPKPEESARDALITLLRPQFEPKQIRVEPEGHMAEDNRADIVLLAQKSLKLPVELKRDYHRDVWTACQVQLDRLYTRDPEANGYGLYVVFWYGDKRPENIPPPPDKIPRPQSALEMEEILKALTPEKHRNRLNTMVIDVTATKKTK